MIIRRLQKRKIPTVKQLIKLSRKSGVNLNELDHLITCSLSRLIEIERGAGRIPRASVSAISGAPVRAES
jgi:hypothetical protein